MTKCLSVLESHWIPAPALTCWANEPICLVPTGAFDIAMIIHDWIGLGLVNDPGSKLSL